MNLAARLIFGLALLAPLSGMAQEVGIAARVNDATISNLRLERYFADYLKAQARNVAAIRSPATYTRLKREALNQLIDKELLWQEAQRQGLTVQPAQLEQSRQAMKASFPTPQAFERALANAGFDPDGYADYLSRELAIEQLVQRLAPAAIDEREVRQLLQSNRPRLEQPEQIRVRHILLRLPANADDATAAAAEQRVRAWLEQLRDGADFAELAQRHSQDSTAAAGGDLGYFPRGRMVAPFEHAAFALADGQVSEPVRTDYGWHLIKLVDRRPAQLDEDQALERIRQYLRDKQRAEGLAAILERLRHAARIEVLAIR